MNPQMMIAITGKNYAKPAFDSVISDANAAAGAVTATGGRMGQAMGDASFQTANLAAQFNDIGVMLASGQSPLILAVQQGTQISQVFAGMKPAQAMTALKTALLSLISPMSLITVGTIAAGAALLQWVMNARDMRDIEAVLEEQRTALDKVIAGYELAEEAVRKYREQAGIKPVEEVRSDAEDQRETAQKELEASIRATLAAYQDYDSYIKEYASYGEVDAALAQASALEKIRDAAAAAEPDLDAVIQSLKEFVHSDPYDILKRTADEMLRNAENARAFADNVGEAQTVIDNLPDNVTVQLRLEMAGFTEAQADLKALMPDFRDQFTRMRDEAEAAFVKQRGNAWDSATRAQADQDYAAVLEGIAKAEALHSEARSGGASAAEKQADAYGDVIASLEHERMLVGLSSREQEVLNNIRAAGVDAASEQGRAIRALTEEVHDQQAATEALQSAMEKVGAVGEDAIWGLAEAAKDGKIELSELLNIALQAVKALKGVDFGAVGGGGNNWLSMLFGGGSGAGQWGVQGGFAGYKGTFGIPSYDVGTNYHGGGPARVHDGEIIDLPQGSRVYTAEQSAALLAAARPATPAVQVNTTIINNAGVEISERRIEDGKGGVRQEIVLNRAVAQAIAKPGPAQKAVRSTGQLVRR